jgi:hypothetical protein
MKSYRFRTVVEPDGSVHLSGLPPEQEVEIVVLERPVLPAEMQEWLDDVRARHPFARISKEEILEALRQTREIVWAERHET